MAAEVGTLSKTVQEILMIGDEPPQEYISKQSNFGSVDFSHSLAPIIPIINIGLFSLSSSHDSKEVESELEKLRSALSSVGCFQAVGHGISSSILDKVCEVAEQFFALPVEEKHKYARAVDEFEGYGNDVIVSENQVLDWSYRLVLRIFPEDLRRLNLWPENPNDFREILNEYATKIKSMMDVLFKAMAKSLNLEENSFSNQFGDRALMHARFNFYPPCSRPELVVGLKPHMDRSAITVLLQDGGVEGLQVLIDDKWVRVPIIPHAFVINLGAPMQIMSNGIFKSPIHRAVTNSEKLRISVVVYNEAEKEKEIGPVDGLVDEKRPRLYRNVKNFGDFNYACFQNGKMALDTLKI